MKASLIGIPLDLGAENLGVDIGPNAFRYQDIISKLESAGYESSDQGLTITDLGNIQCNSRGDLQVGNHKLKYLEEILRVSEESAKKTHDVIKKGEKVIVLGGDHSIILGPISGTSAALNGDLGLIYFDVHGDMNTEETTISGNIHGMHLASLMGYGTHSLVNVFKKGIKVKKENMIHIAGAEFDQGEIDLMEKEDLNMFTIFDILSNGLRPLFDAIEDLSKRVKNVWVSLDLDSIDNVYAPGAGMVNRGGLTYREVTAIASFIGKNCQVVGVDVVEYNPLSDIEGKTAELAIELVTKFFGSNYSWYATYMNQNKVK
jgi:arginase